MESDGTCSACHLVRGCRRVIRWKAGSRTALGANLCGTLANGRGGGWLCVWSVHKHGFASFAADVRAEEQQQLPGPIHVIPLVKRDIFMLKRSRDQTMGLPLLMSE